MHELRKDPLLGRWVAVLKDSKSPSEYEGLPEYSRDGACPLCEGNEKNTLPEIVSLRKEGSRPNSPGWYARVLPKPGPILHIEGDLGRRGVGMYDSMNSIGANEIIVEAPGHDMRPEDMGEEQMKRVLSLYRMRVTDLEKDQRIRYVFICKNSGKWAGAISDHPHSEVVATPIIPKLLKDELDSSKQYYAYKERCVFCDIMAEELRTGGRVIEETRDFVAFCPYAPKFAFEFWIMPKRHHCAFQETRDEELEDLSRLMAGLLKKMRKALKEPSFHYVLHTAPNRMPRRDHWHTLGDDFHWHIEVAPRLLSASGFEWGSEFYVITTSPEDSAKYLKEA